MSNRRPARVYAIVIAGLIRALTFGDAAVGRYLVDGIDGIDDRAIQIGDGDWPYMGPGMLVAA